MEPTPTATPIPSLATPPPISTNPVVPPPPPPNPSRNFLPWVIGGGIIILLLIILIGINTGLALIRSAFRYTPPPPAPALPAPVVNTTPVSGKYATDAGVLKLRDDLKTISQSVDAVDLLEPQIAPPALDLSISIKTNP